MSLLALPYEMKAELTKTSERNSISSVRQIKRIFSGLFVFSYEEISVMRAFASPSGDPVHVRIVSDHER